MLRLNALHEGIRPALRDRSKFEEIARILGEVERLGEDPLFVGWPAQPGYPHRADRFERFRQDLLGAARAGRQAAENGDAEALHSAYALLDASCTACHKRYSPTY